VWQEIERACTQLSGDAFAVRSSAVVEDGVKAAWAGQFCTYLSVPSSALREKIELCMESGVLPGPQAYGALHAIDATTVPIAVLIQEMVMAESAGVIFTKDPVSNDVGKVVIEAVSGLGHALVGGLETPDTYIVEKVSKVCTLAHQRDSVRTILSNDAVRHLTDLALTLEKHFGTPQDIEWAYSAGVYWVLQSRPITTF
jgi:pyruvate,water dikinase